MAKVTNYGELKTEVASWINRKNITAEIPGFVQAAEDRLANEVRIPDMISRSTGTFDTSFLPLNEDLFVEMSTIKTDLGILTHGGFQITKDTFGTFGVYVEPDPTGCDYELVVYERYAPLADDADENWLLRNHYMAYLAPTMVAANIYLKDVEQAAAWEALYQQKLAELDRINRRAKYPAGSLGSALA